MLLRKKVWAQTESLAHPRLRKVESTPIRFLIASKCMMNGECRLTEENITSMIFYRKRISIAWRKTKLNKGGANSPNHPLVTYQRMIAGKWQTLLCSMKLKNCLTRKCPNSLKTPKWDNRNLIKASSLEMSQNQILLKKFSMERLCKPISFISHTITLQMLLKITTP